MNHRHRPHGNQSPSESTGLPRMPRMLGMLGMLGHEMGIPGRSGISGAVRWEWWEGLGVETVACHVIYDVSSAAQRCNQLFVCHASSFVFCLHTGRVHPPPRSTPSPIASLRFNLRPHLSMINSMNSIISILIG